LEIQFKENILGPEPPPIGRIKNKYIINLLIKIPKKQSLEKTKKYIENVQRSFNSIKEFSSVRVNIDVDNY
jgi:primosomal protein N' (replication factor Y)